MGAAPAVRRAQQPGFVLRSRIDQLLHGSCRKPHYPAAEGLLCADRLLAAGPTAEQRPALLLLSGDQVYADDVAGPMLRAIHQLITRLGLFDERLDGAVVDDSQALYRHPASYRRADLLPALESNGRCASASSVARRNPSSPAATQTTTW